MKKTGCKNSRDIVPLKTAKTQDAVFKMRKKWFKYCKTLCTVHKERSLNVKISLFFMKKIVFIVRIKNCKNSVHCSRKDVCIYNTLYSIVGIKNCENKKLVLYFCKKGDSEN